ncbi:nucleolar protein 11-like [Diadema setosum]|uniref:nucleolar protein 11-like n=1 Tax=Diadema setosum TaxID=31175 RepID=UPI003B3AC1A5
MVRIEDGISLLSVNDGTEIHNVDEFGQNQKFVSTSSRTVAVFKVPDSKPLHSWLTKLSSPFTCAAVCCGESDEIVAVVKHKQIYRWSVECADPLKQKPLVTLKSPISRIFRAHDNQILVLMMNGTLRWLDHATRSPGTVREGCLEDGEEIRDAWVWQQGAKEEVGTKEHRPCHVICLIQEPTKMKCSLLVHSVGKMGTKEGESKDAVRILLEPPVSGEDGTPALLSASCLTDSSAVLYTLWEGGHVCCTHIPKSKLKLEKEPQRLVCHLKFTVPGSEQEMRIAAISDRLVAIAGSQRLPSSGEHKATLFVWDTTYGTLQAQHSLVSGEDEGMSDMTLAASLGSLAETEEGVDLPVLVQAGDWTCQEETSKKPRGKSGVTKETARSGTKLTALVQKVCDQTKTNTAKKFSLAVEELLKSFQDSVPDSSALTLVLKSVMKRTEENTGFWSEKALHDVIATNVIAASSCPEFVGMLARRGEVSLLLDCLSFMRDFPELSLVRCLQVFLSIDEDKLPAMDTSTEDNHTGDSTTNPDEDVISVARRQLVDEVLSKPFTDSFMLDAIKHLHFKEVVLLLKYLYLLLTNSFSGKMGAHSEVSMDNVVDWIGVLLDAHFAQLVLVPDVRPLIAKLQEAVKQQVAFSLEVNAIQNLLRHASSPKSHVKSQSKNASQSYSIEILKM